jgi:Fe-S-cluster containining protein
MIPVPWKYIESWNCRACGECCKPFTVILTLPEWLNITRLYGLGVTQPGINGFYLKKNAANRCVFQYKLLDKWLCGIQHIKPMACKLWPFKICENPKYGRRKEASYIYQGREFFIYADTLCHGLKLGNPSRHFIQKILPEFIEISLGLRKEQHYSTFQLPTPLIIKPTII